MGAGAHFADGKSVEIGLLDKPEAIHRLPPSGGGRGGVMRRKKKESDGGEEDRQVILPHSGEITMLRRRNSRNQSSVERRDARPTTITARGYSLYNSYPHHHCPKNW